MISGSTRVFALLGRPVLWSRSPRLHNTLFAARGIDAVYVALPVTPGSEEQLGGAIRAMGLAGVNLTTPLKELALEWVDRLDASAWMAGAVNTLVREGTEWVGYNTDGPGFLDALAVEAPALNLAGARAVVLGAGGAGRAVAQSLRGAGARVRICNRDLARARELAGRLAAEAAALEPDVLCGDGRGGEAGPDLVVNCLGAGAEATTRALRLPSRPITWMDTNYWQVQPPQEREVLAAGGRFVRGDAMLLHQGLRAFSLFTGEVVSRTEALSHLGSWP
jgi:shikimate dehydrogenase